MDRVYLDTSFFIGLLENQDNRREEAKKILACESRSLRFTSELTLCEFMVRVYDEHKDSPECDKFISDAEVEIRAVASVMGTSGDIYKEAAKLQSKFGEIHKHKAPPKEPRDRKFRWDAIHIATARELKCNRIYAWDGKWSDLPKEITSGMGEIIAPALCPALLLFEQEATEATGSDPGTSVGEGET